DEPDPFVSSVRRRARDDPRRARKIDDDSRLRDLRAGLLEPPRRPRQRAHGRLLRALADAHRHQALGVRRHGRTEARVIAGTGAARRIASGAMLTAVALLWLGPYAWMTLTSLKTLPEIVAAPTYPLPRSLALAAYREVFEQVPILRYFM